MTPVLCPVLRPSSPPSSTLPLCLCTRVSSWSGEYLKSHGASVRTASQQHNPDASFYSIRSYNLQFCCLSCLRLSFLSLFFLFIYFFYTLCVGMRLSTPCFLYSPWSWTKMWSQKWPCSTQSFIRTSLRFNPIFLIFGFDSFPSLEFKQVTTCLSLFQGRSLSFKTFLIWVLISVYQGVFFLIIHSHLLPKINFQVIAEPSTAWFYL